MPARLRVALFLPLLALLLGSALVSPAGAFAVPAAVPDPVTNVVVGSVTQGAGQSWVIPVSWDGSATATHYTVSITNLAGSTTYASKDASATSTTLTTSDLLDGGDYKASVTPVNVDGDGTAVTAQFTAIPLDRTAPAGTFTVVPTHEFLTFDFFALEDQTAYVTITQTALSDDTPSTTITRRVLAGDGTASQSWPAGSTFKVKYTKAGTFTPKVQLTDGFGNTDTVALSPVTISSDLSSPVVGVTRPTSALRSRIAGWRRIRGTATDTGTGIEAVAVMVLQKRGGLWYAYSFGSHKWLKGRKGEIATLAHTRAMPAFPSLNSLDQWRTARIRGLRTGKISVRALALDGAFNLGRAPVVRQRITRR